MVRRAHVILYVGDQRVSARFYEQVLATSPMLDVPGMTEDLSHQLRFLRDRGAVSREKVGRIAYYRLVDEHLRRLVLDASSHVAEAAA